MLTFLLLLLLVPAFLLLTLWPSMERLNDLGVSHLSVLGLTVAAFHYYLNQSNISLMETLTEIIQGAIVALTLIITARYFSTLYNRHQAENKTLRPLVVGKKL
jgi:hypothetical protein